MQRIIPHLTAALLISAGAAQAETRCAVPMSNWQPRSAVERLADQNGWTLRRIKIDDGCYEVKGTDANGRKLKVKIHPATLAVLDYGQEDDDHKDGDHKDDDRDKHKDDD